MTDQVIDEIKQKVDIVEFIGRYVQLKPSGSSYKALCPFHQEKTPSFFVSPERGFFKCFGCGESGDVISFLMKIEGLDFTEALKQLADLAGVKLSRLTYSGQDKDKDQLYQVNKLAARFYHHLLTKHQAGRAGLDYLKQRGLTNKTISSFYLGWAPNQWDGLSRFLTKKGIDLKIAQQAGLVVQKGSRVYDRFRGRVIFPLFNILGEVVGFGGRSLVDDPQTPKYINSPETLIYHKSRHLFGLYQAKLAIRSRQEVIVTEGEFDVIMAHQAGLKQTVAVKGSALTAEHIKILKRYTKKVIFAFDNDPAGLKATQAGLILADNYNLEGWVVKLPPKMDLDDYLKTKTFQTKRLQIVSGFQYLLDHWQQRIGLESVNHRRRFLETAFEFISQIQDVFVKDNYLELTAKALNNDKNLIQQAYQQYLERRPLTQAGAGKTRSPQDSTKPVAIPPQLYILSLLVRSAQPELIQLVPESIFEGHSERNLFKLIKQFNAQPKDIESNLPTQLESSYNQLFTLPGVDNILAKGQSAIAREIKRLVKRLNRDLIQAKIDKLKQTIKDKERQGLPTHQELELINQYLKQLN